MLHDTFNAFSAQDQTWAATALSDKIAQNCLKREFWRVIADNDEVVRCAQNQTTRFGFVPRNRGIESRILKNLLECEENALTDATAVRDCLKPFDGRRVKQYLVSSRVNRAKNDDQECAQEVPVPTPFLMPISRVLASTGPLNPSSFSTIPFTDISFSPQQSH